MIANHPSANPSRLGKALVAALFTIGLFAAVPGAPAQADEGEYESTSIETRTQPAKVNAGGRCSKRGKKSGNFTCKRSKDKLVWVRTGGLVIKNALCATSTYTSQVSGLKCSSTTITFGSTGLPSAGTPMMVGITATNQQYPRTHNYTLNFPRVAQVSSATTAWVKDYYAAIAPLRGRWMHQLRRCRRSSPGAG